MKYLRVFLVAFGTIAVVIGGFAGSAWLGENVNTLAGIAGLCATFSLFAVILWAIFESA